MNPPTMVDGAETPAPKLPAELATDLIVAEILATQIAALLDMIQLAVEQKDRINEVGRDHLIAHTIDLALKLRDRLTSALCKFDAELADADPTNQEIGGEL